MAVAAILAAGSGTRMGSAVPKQFMLIGGVPIIIHSINAFLKSELIDRVIVAVSPDQAAYTEELIGRYVQTDKRIDVIGGGSYRGGTLIKILSFLEETGSLDCTVLTHDAVRPFIDESIIRDNVEAVEKYGSCNTCIGAVDTVFISEDGRFMDSVPDRRTVFHSQTPQSFRADVLYDLIKKTPVEVFEKMTDAPSVFAWHGRKTAIVPGSTDNIKITFPEDIERAEMIWKGRK